MPQGEYLSVSSYVESSGKRSEVKEVLGLWFYSAQSEGVQGSWREPIALSRRKKPAARTWGDGFYISYGYRYRVSGQEGDV